MKLRYPDPHILVISLLVALLLLVAVGLAFHFRSDLRRRAPDELLDEALMRFRDYGQAEANQLVDNPAPLTPWNPLAYHEDRLSKEKLAVLRSNRAAIIPVLVQRLQQIDLTRSPVEVPLDNNPDESMNGDGADGFGVDPKAFNNLLLVIIFEMNVIETLPALLNVEEKLHDTLLHLENDPTSPLPEMDGFDNVHVMEDSTPAERKDARSWDSLSDDEKSQYDRLDQICQIQVAHRNTLALIGHLLRQERNPALLATPTERQFQKALRDNPDIPRFFHSFKTLDDIPQDQRSYITFDPIVNVPHYINFSIEVPYSEALRDEIIQAARTHKPN